MGAPVSFRLGVIVTAAIALVAVIGGYVQMSRTVFETQLGDTLHSAQSTVRAYERSTHRTLHEIDVTLQSFAQRYVEGGLASARRIIDHGWYDANLIHHFSVFDVDGNLVFRSEGRDPVDNLRRQALYSFHRSTGQTLMFVGAPYLGSATGRPLLRFSRRLEDGDGGFAGIVIANVDPDQLSDFYQQAMVGPRGTVALVGLDRLVLAMAAGSGQMAVGSRVDDAGLWEGLAKSVTGIYRQSAEGDGQARVYVYRQVQGYPVVVKVGVAISDVEDTVAPLRRHLLVIVVLLTVSILIVAVFLIIQHRNSEQLKAALAVNRDFLARVSHELRTPLNAILGFSEVIKDQMLGPGAGPRYTEYARDIHNSGQHLLNLINDILDLSRLQAGRMDLNMEALEVRPTVEWAIRIITPQAQDKAIQVECAVDPEISRIMADERALKQMLLNLLTNAVKFTPAGGRILVSVSRGDRGRCVVRISDNGIGMTPEQLRQAVVPFGQVSAMTTRPGQGTGLGLSIVKSLIEAHGGRMWIDSRPGQGSQITLEFAA